MEQYIPDTTAYVSWNPLLVILWSEWSSTYVSGLYCSILITVSNEEDPNLHMQWCQVYTVPFWSQYHKKGIPTYIEWNSTYLTPLQYVSWNSLLVILWSEWNSTYLTPLHMQVRILFLWYCDQNGFHSYHSITRRGFQRTYAGVSGMYCSILITLSQEENSNFHMQGFQVCTVPFWSQYWNST
jgi:hypothetical protein